MSQATRRALYGKMAGDSTLTALLHAPPSNWGQSIFYEQAPSEAHFPFIIFNKQSGTPDYAFKNTNTLTEEVWLIKAVDKDDKGPPSHETADTADAISARLDALLTDGTITISGKTECYLRRESDVDYAENADGVVYRHAGSLFRLVYT